MINDSDKMIMAKNIQKLMDINNKSRQDLCNALGFKYSTLSEWLQAKKYPRADKISKLASYFNVSRSELVDPPSQSNINIINNNGAVSGSGNATYVNESHVTYGAVQGECMRLIEALFGDSPEVLSYIKSLKISQSGKIEGLENIDVTSKALLDGARTTWIAALRNALEKGSNRVQIPV